MLSHWMTYFRFYRLQMGLDNGVQSLAGYWSHRSADWWVFIFISSIRRCLYPAVTIVAIQQTQTIATVGTTNRRGTTVRTRTFRLAVRLFANCLSSQERRSKRLTKTKRFLRRVSCRVEKETKDLGRRGCCSRAATGNCELCYRQF